MFLKILYTCLKFHSEIFSAFKSALVLDTKMYADKAKWPELLTFIEKIPLSAIGKVQRGVLEEHVYDIVRKNLK